MSNNNGDYKPLNYRIVRHVTKTSILVIEDCLRLDKLRVEIVSYQRGEGVRATVEHYLDTDVARLLFSELARGRLSEPYQEFKGTMRDGQPQSRVFRLYEAKAQNPIKPVLSLSKGWRSPTVPARWWARGPSSRPASPTRAWRCCCRDGTPGASPWRYWHT